MASPSTDLPTPRSWAVVARNLAEHARNPIHTDAGAQAAGFPRALIAGVTTYAYLTHPVVAAWGTDWLATGGGEVRFHSPVFLDDDVHCVPEPDGDTTVVIAQVNGMARVTFRATPPAPSTMRTPPAPIRSGEALRTRSIRLEGDFGADYGSRAGDDLTLYAQQGLVHPAVWPALANHLVHADVARGPWIHTASIIRHHRAVPAGITADLVGVVVQRTNSRAGERAVLDVRIEVDGEPVASLEHHAIVALPGA